MFPVYGLDFFSAGLVQAAPVRIQITEDIWVKSDECCLMQSTGKKSKAGIEIFENDLVTRTCTHEDCDGPHTGEVIWDNMYMQWVIEDTAEEEFFPLCCYDPEAADEMEVDVIGNVWQIPPTPKK